MIECLGGGAHGFLSCRSGRIVLWQKMGLCYAPLQGLTKSVAAAFPSFAMQAVVFFYFFQRRGKGADNMTPAQEMDNSWTRVRDNEDIDELIFVSEDYYASDR